MSSCPIFFQQENVGQGLFLYDRKVRPIIQNAPRGCALGAMGRWLLKQPRLGARMCLGTFFILINDALRA